MNKVSDREKRALIHRKLEVMKKCYQERDEKNFDLFFDAFFDRDRLPFMIGTDNGAWFRTMGQIRWLIAYDWGQWGELEVDTWNFTIREAGNYDMVTAKGLLDFGQDRAWDVDIVMIFEEYGKGYFCRVMQFKIPRNEIRPVVILNRDEMEQIRSEKEMRDLQMLNGNVTADLMRGQLVDRITRMLSDSRPYLDHIDVRREMIYMEESGDCFLFAMTGFCVHTELNALMPFRMVGIGRGYEILSAEFSHPFASSLG